MDIVIMWFSCGASAMFASIACAIGAARKHNIYYAASAVVLAVTALSLFGAATFLAAPKELGWHTQIGVDGSTLSYPAPNH